MATSLYLVARLHLLHAHLVNVSITHGLIWCLSSSLSLSVGFSIQDEAMVRATGAHCHADVIYLLR